MRNAVKGVLIGSLIVLHAVVALVHACEAQKLQIPVHTIRQDDAKSRGRDRMVCCMVSYVKRHKFSIVGKFQFEKRRAVTKQVTSQGRGCTHNAHLHDHSTAQHTERIRMRNSSMASMIPVECEHFWVALFRFNANNKMRTREQALQKGPFHKRGPALRSAPCFSCASKNRSVSGDEISGNNSEQIQ